MTRTYKCVECRAKIVIESRNKADFPPKSECILCQKCDPGFASLADNKHHRTQITPAGSKAVALVRELHATQTLEEARRVGKQLTEANEELTRDQEAHPEAYEDR